MSAFRNSNSNNQPWLLDSDVEDQVAAAASQQQQQPPPPLSSRVCAPAAAAVVMVNGTRVELHIVGSSSSSRDDDDDDDDDDDHTSDDDDDDDHLSFHLQHFTGTVRLVVVAPNNNDMTDEARRPAERTTRSSSRGNAYTIISSTKDKNHPSASTTSNQDNEPEPPNNHVVLLPPQDRQPSLWDEERGLTDEPAHSHPQQQHPRVLSATTPHPTAAAFSSSSPNSENLLAAVSDCNDVDDTTNNNNDDGNIDFPLPRHLVETVSRLHVLFAKQQQQQQLCRRSPATAVRIRNAAGGSAAASTKNPADPDGGSLSFIRSSSSNKKYGLHRLCAQTDSIPSSEEWDNFSIQRKDASRPLPRMDSFSSSFVNSSGRAGRLPLHILGDNEYLMRNCTNNNKAAVATFAVRLLHVYPEAMTVLDDNDATGRMPFVPLVDDWVRWAQQQQRPAANANNNAAGVLLDRVLHPTTTMRNVTNNTTTTTSEAAAEDAERSAFSQADAMDGNKNNNNSNHPLPLSSVHSLNEGVVVELWEEAEFCLVMLSAALDVLRGDGCGGGSYSTSRRATLLRDENGNVGAEHEKQRERQAQADQACRKLASHLVQAVPDLLPTIFSLDDETKERVLAMNIIKAVLFCPESVGPWLTQMLQNGAPLSKRNGVDYLRAVSQLTARDRFGASRAVVSAADFGAFRRTKERVFDAVGGLNGIVASLVVLEEVELEQALRTTVTWHIMSKKLSRPFVVSQVLIDLVLHLTLMLVRGFG